jgi:dihydrofolate reductase
LSARSTPKPSGKLKAAATRDISVGGPTLAAQAMKSGLVDECNLFLSPIVVGDGKRVLPDHVRVELELLDERRFRNGVVHLHYRVKGDRSGLELGRL